MERFKLTSDLLTNISDIDDQHRELLSWANLLLYPKRILKDSKDFTITLTLLARYSRYHFLAEEEGMERFHYDRIEGHKKHHQKFRQDIKNLYKRAKKEGATRDIKQELHNMFYNWFFNHIKRWDRAFAEFLRKKQAAAAFRLAGLEDLGPIDKSADDELDGIDDTTVSRAKL